MQYRHEVKHEINYSDMLILKSRLCAVMKPDSHATGGKYKVRSFYFDTPSDKVLREKIDGVSRREKFRIRYYNGDTSTIFLEKKSKLGGLCAKESCRITEDEAKRIISGDIFGMAKSEHGLLTELYSKMRAEGLRVKTVVDYTRQPFVYPAGNVRVTIDYDVRTGLPGTDLSDLAAVTLPAGESLIILEVKWDEFLPDIIRDAVNLDGRHESAFSKYAQCRIYG